MYFVFLSGTAVDLDSNSERDSNILALKTSTFENDVLGKWGVVFFCLTNIQSWDS